MNTTKACILIVVVLQALAFLCATTIETSLNPTENNLKMENDYRKSRSLESIGDWVKGIAKNATDTVGSSIGNATDTVGSAVGNATDTVGSTAGKVYDKLTNKTNPTASDYVSASASQYGSVGDDSLSNASHTDVGSIGDDSLSNVSHTDTGSGSENIPADTFAGLNTTKIPTPEPTEPIMTAGSESLSDETTPTPNFSSAQRPSILSDLAVILTVGTTIIVSNLVQWTV